MEQKWVKLFTITFKTSVSFRRIIWVLKKET
jgi:hypothetical protein